MTPERGLRFGQRKDHSPLYCRIAESLRAKIFAGEYAPLARLPAEKVLGEIYDASRITIRSALKKMETEGLIHRVNGKGTFVAKLKGKQRQIVLVLEKAPGEARHLHELVMGALIKAQEDGFSLLVVTCTQFRGFMKEAIANPARQTGALLLRCREFHREDIVFAEKHGIPCLLEGGERLKGLNWMAIDNEGAIRQLVDHLHGLGRRRFGIFSEETPSAWSPFKERQAAARARLTALGVPDKDISSVTLHPGDRPYDLTAAFFKGGKKPDALICVNDIIAVQALKWLADNGRHVPKEVAVTGFDDILPARFATPPLTTVCQNYYEAGAAAVAQLRSMMDDFDNKRVQIVRRLPLVIRASTKG